ncbi:hypothetical protein IC575_009688 [Cucumis melo]
MTNLNIWAKMMEEARMEECSRNALFTKLGIDKRKLGKAAGNSQQLEGEVFIVIS